MAEAVNAAGVEFGDVSFVACLSLFEWLAGYGERGDEEGAVSGAGDDWQAGTVSILHLF